MKTRIIYEDDAILVVYKPSGLATQTAKPGEPDLVSEMRNYLGRPYIGLVHRLDQPVEGILVLGKTGKAAGELNAQIAENHVKKYYYAVVHGVPDKKEVTLIDYIKKENRTNSSMIADKNDKAAKRAELSYRLLATIKEAAVSSLLDIQLQTGRHHQIRVQLSHAGIPICGDNKYGIADNLPIALCAHRLLFSHPLTMKKMEFQMEPEGKAFVPFIGKY